MASRIWLVAFFIFASKGVSHGNSCDSIAEPCYLYNSIEMPYLDTRDPSIPYSSATSDSKYCDLFALDNNVWYRSDYNMTTAVVGQQMCGANEPIWLNGSIPEPADGVVSRDACVKSFFDDCSTIYTVKIKHCYFFTVYCFPSILSGCHKRFCFDVNITAVTTSTTTTTATTITGTTASPVTSSSNKVNGCEIKSDSDGICMSTPVVVTVSLLGLCVVAVLGFLLGVLCCIKRPRSVNCYVTGNGECQPNVFPGEKNIKKTGIGSGKSIFFAGPHESE